VLVYETDPGGSGVWIGVGEVEDDEFAAALAIGSTTATETDEDNRRSKIATEDGFLIALLPLN